MLPPILCEELCSLNPSVERLAFSVVWRMQRDGALVRGAPGRPGAPRSLPIGFDNYPMIGTLSLAVTTGGTGRAAADAIRSPAGAAAGRGGRRGRARRRARRAPRACAPRRFALLLGRAWRQNWRDAWVNSIRFGVSAGLALVFGEIFGNLATPDAATVADRVAVLSYATINMAMMAMTKVDDNLMNANLTGELPSLSP